MLKRKKKSVEAQHIPAKLPRHVAFIMDGNGRWASARLMPRVEGHRAGAKTVRMVVEESRRLGIRYVTLFAFSTENWKRPAGEVSALMELFVKYLSSEIELLTQNNIRLRVIGEISRLPQSVQESLAATIRATEGGTAMDLVLAVSYGGRAEIVEAARKIAREVAAGGLDPAQIDESTVAERLYAPDIPDPDLLVRTSNEHRISNFLLWQLAYAEIVMSPVLWPDFTKEEYLRCLCDYAGRERRFGQTNEQVAARETAATGVIAS